MVAETDGARCWARWAAERHQPGLRGLLGNTAVILAAAGLAVGGLYLSRVISARNVAPAAITIVALAAVVGVAAGGAARWVHGALGGRVDILSQALDASPDAQLILAPDGRIAYANTAFHDLFAQSGEPALARIAASLADAESTADFERLRSRAVAGPRAIAALPLRIRAAGPPGWFNIAVNPMAGRPGYSFWSFEDVTARHEMEQVIRDERNKLADFLDDAPIGFYSVDGAGRFLFVNQALGRLARRARRPSWSSGGARLRDFLAAAAAGGRAAACARSAARRGGQRGEVVLKGRQGASIHASISQSVVRAGDELRTRSVVRDLTPEREWEEALRLSRQRFQRFFANAPVGIALIDRERPHRGGESGARRLFGARAAAI